MSPNWGRFIEFQSIEPKTVKLAVRTIFMATGVGHMKIDIPNGKSNTCVMLKDVLYSLELGYTLVSLAKCDTTGFTIVLKKGSCHLQDPKGHQIGHIPQVQGLYQVNNPGSTYASTYMGVRVFTVDELHRKMGNISPTAIKRLVRQKTILGLELQWLKKLFQRFLIST